MRKKIIRILDLFPNLYMEEFEEDLTDRESLSKQIEQETNGLVKLETVFVDKGNASIEGMHDEAFAAPYILQKVKWAEENNFDAIVVDCFIDVALDAARELVQIPVFGPCQSSSSLAVRLGGRFSIISILPEMDRPIRANIAKYGFDRNLVSIPIINVPVLDLQREATKVVQKIVEVSEKATREDGAYVLVFGCTGMSPLIKSVQTKLVGRGINIPIIEPLRAAIYDAIACSMMGVSHSKEAYRPVRNKYRVVDWK